MHADYVYDEPVVGLIAEDAAITAAVAGNDTNHLTWSNIVGCMNGGARRRRLSGFNYGDAVAARRLAGQHAVAMTDSFTEYQTNASISPSWILQDIEHLKAISQPGQPLV
eukprot:SAG22_NODE_7861_length_701_cov_1.466777_2_plen_110_part_00